VCAKVNKRQSPRVTGVYILFLIAFFALTAKIVYLQVFRKAFFQKLANNQHYKIIPISGGRGDILDRKGRPLAKGMNSYSIFADPLLVDGPKSTAQKLGDNLGIAPEELLEKLQKNKRFVWIKRKVSWKQKKTVEELNLRGIAFLREEKRFYPQKTLAASVLGISGIDNRGLEGLELAYDDYLRGKDGLTRILRDSMSKDVLLSPNILEPQKGAEIYLTLDAQIQYWAENFAQNTVDEFQAVSASVVVMEARRGEILALANIPGFDPNDFKYLGPQAMRNRAIADAFEPGSVFKIVALTAAIAQDTFSDEHILFCENGRYKIPGSVLNDWRPHGDLTFQEVFMKSSNIGVAKVVEKIGGRVFARYIDLFEFGKLTGIDLPAETAGLRKPYRQWSKTSQYIVPIGQEIGVNLVQMARAFAVFANGGILVKPFLVERVCSRGFCRQTKPEGKRIIPGHVAQRAKNILIKVVNEGTGKRAAIEGFTVGGKTGTAQKYDPEIGKYSPRAHRASFIGFLPELDPPIVIGVSVDEPKKSHLGGVVAAPLFKNIAEKTAVYISADHKFAKNDIE
jgi:cell division protein FtsI (penicillin-binding protein 3)